MIDRIHEIVEQLVGLYLRKDYMQSVDVNTSMSAEADIAQPKAIEPPLPYSYHGKETSTEGVVEVEGGRVDKPCLR